MSADPRCRGKIIGDHVLRTTLGNLDARLRERFGARYSRLILFGSRARGDSKADSDVDVAVVFHSAGEDRWALTKAIIEETFELLLETNLYIDFQIIEEGALLQPTEFPDVELTREVLRDGLML